MIPKNVHIAVAVQVNCTCCQARIESYQPLVNLIVHDLTTNTDPEELSDALTTCAAALILESRRLDQFLKSGGAQREV